MPIYDCGASDCDECQRAFGHDRSKAIANHDARERAYANMIPGAVYWSREMGNFYSVVTNKGMGLEFYDRWQARKDEFPERATTAVGIDLNLTATVSVK